MLGVTIRFFAGYCGRPLTRNPVEAKLTQETNGTACCHTLPTELTLHDY